ncbi:transcription termination/antitermination protein NusG [Leisingera sp. NJS204]|uniref:transcription termination/antitermination protein NusG n=1 Tax=Leisingera sp. NJS204 TaxID=2508307 RepID=UPI0013E909BE|nr:transcription termination/antitermination NusG family protein [Leisingera sp. NJS204]
MIEQNTQWFAVRTGATANPNRATTITGGEYETYTGRGGVTKHRLKKGTGRREFVVEVLLKKQGFQVFLPTKSGWRFKSRYSKTKQEVSYPLLVGWIFVAMPTRFDPIRQEQVAYGWDRLMKTGLVLQVVCVDGRPRPVPQARMEKLFKRWGGQQTRAPERERFMRTHREFQVGDQAVVATGSLAGFAVEVTALRGPNAVVLLDIFGREQEHEIPAMQLEAA